MALTSLSSVPITTLKGVGPKVAEKLKKLGIFCIEDALFHLPLRYEDRSRVYPIAHTVVGTHVAVVGQVTSCNIQFGRKRMLVVKIGDATGGMTLRFFNFSAAQKNSLEDGTWIKCFGEIRGGKFGPEILHPDYVKINGPNDVIVEESLTPIYPTTEGVKQATLRTITEQALSRLEKYRVDELIPFESLPNQYSLVKALQICHRPPVDTDTSLLDLGIHPAQQRLAFEELCAYQASMLNIKKDSQQVSAVAFPIKNDYIDKFLHSLPFTPTAAQSRVVADITKDLNQPLPMMRLVQGDVGSGKTLVAALSALTVIAQGYQVALMAPTEILAEQHANNFRAWFEPLGINVAWIAGKSKAAEKRDALEVIGNGEAKMIVGTHAIFQDQVEFANLALIIIDEQHRFGVHQRLSLRNKGAIHFEDTILYPHQLVMTATPIPRTLAMTAYADLDCSIIDELPPGRTPITTVVIPDTKREQVIERVKHVCITTGQQAYWVCTLVEESEALQCQAAEDAAIELQSLLPELKIGLVHGRMKADEKQNVMQAFKNGELNLLVATTVIEVGVDVPNASLMIIENPERLGLAQLHQLRGRVGRGALQSHCVLLYHAPLSQTAQQRLAVLRDSNDGFIISEKDLEIRGAGEILGTRQTGLADFKIADLDRDATLCERAIVVANDLLISQPERIPILISRWLGEKQLYGNA
ncbi:ATP-dependent DNA helicase RecG [Psychrosphaera aestuarii]|uniref:ATP-dependent DNA helicase RecG n=1 Tax=Psychrosphaera aestuarii TaxID=1266052 RepID=UPI001B333FE0|nr:ATP-dependent DNA helicase RecG [Psychrosphaera aestuarii]